MNYCTKQDSTLTLVVREISNAKAIVDNYGEEALYYVLKLVADSIRSRIREYDIVGRLDENTLSFLMRDTSREIGRNIGGRVFKRIETESFISAGANLLVKVANGFVHFDPQSDDRHASELIEDARVEIARNKHGVETNKPPPG